MLAGAALPCGHNSPRDQIGRVGDDGGADAHVALLNHLDGAGQVLGHAQAGHDDGQSAARKGAHGELVLDVAQLAAAAAAGAQNAHVEQLLQQGVLLLAAEGVGGVEVRDAVGELAQRAAELVVLAVVVAALDGVAAHDERLAVVVVGLVRVEVDFAQELLLMVLEFARHGGGARGGGGLAVLRAAMFVYAGGRQKVEAAGRASR